MNPAVLLISSKFDFSTDEVALGLAAEGVPFLRLNREQLVEHRLSLDPIASRLSVDGPAGACEVGPGLRSIWFRHPVFLRNPVVGALSPTKQLGRSQWQAFIQALTLFLRCWLDEPPSRDLPSRVQAGAAYSRAAGRLLRS